MDSWCVAVRLAEGLSSWNFGVCRWRRLRASWLGGVERLRLVSASIIGRSLRKLRLACAANVSVEGVVIQGLPAQENYALLTSSLVEPLTVCGANQIQFQN